MKDQGGRSLHLAELVFTNRPITGLRFAVYIDREATLNETVSDIEHRKVRDVSIVLREGYEDEQRIRIASPETLTAMRDALTAALDRIQGEWFDGQRVGGA